MTLPFASPKALARAGAAPARPVPTPDGYARVEDEVARTADLVLKVHRLLERARGLEAEPDRAARMARLAWVVEHGQVALRRAAGPPDPFPRPRAQA